MLTVTKRKTALLLQIKYWALWYMDHLSASSYTGVTNFQTRSGFYGLNYLVFSGWHRFPEVTQKYLNMTSFKIAILLLIKSWTFWYIELLPTSLYTGVTYYQKWSSFFAHPVYVPLYSSVFCYVRPFLPCDCEAYARYCYWHSVCPSVCLSVKRVYCDKTKAPSEKSSIMTNRKSPTNFPMSLRWTAYLAPNPQRGLRSDLFHFPYKNWAFLEESLLQSFFVWKLSAAKL